MPPPRWKLTFDLLIMKVVSETCVTWATPVPILVFLDLSVLELGPMYATDRRQTASLLGGHDTGPFIWFRSLLLLAFLFVKDD